MIHQGKYKSKNKQQEKTTSPMTTIELSKLLTQGKST